MTDINDARDRVFTNADAIIDSLGDEFTSQVFLRRVMHDQQHAYIDLLVACKHLDGPFDQAHQKIGRRLLDIMRARGWDVEKRNNDDINIFLKKTDRTIYRKAK